MKRAIILAALLLCSSCAGLRGFFSAPIANGAVSDGSGATVGGAIADALGTVVTVGTGNPAVGIAAGTILTAVLGGGLAWKMKKG